LAAVQTVSTGTSNDKVPVATAGNSNNNTAKPSYEELEKRSQALEAKLKIAEAANQEIQNVNDSLAKRVETIELNARTKEIAAIVEGAYDEKIRDEKIQFFIKKNLSPEDVSEIVAPLKASRAKQTMKQASISGGGAAEYNSTVAIQNEGSSGLPNGKKEVPAWASNYLDLINGGGGA